MRIWKSHLLMVEDHSIRQMVVEKISNEFLSAGEAFHLAVFKYIEILNRSEYTRERSADLKDTASHLLQNLSGLKNKSFKKICDRVIIVAKNILPTDMLEMKNQNVCGLCLEDGSRTGHVAILARSFNIPTIMGIHRLFDNVQGGEQLILDGYDGIAILNPVKETLDFYRKKIDEEMLLFREIQSENSLDAQTTDGFRIKLMANVEGCTNSDDLIKYGADGIGLFRTEYMFLKSNSIPDEETQFQTFKQQLLQMQGKPLVIRT